MSSMDGFKPIDADGHITESVAQLVPYLDAPYSRRDRFYPTDGWNRSLGGKLGTRAKTAVDWGRVADEAGLERVYLYPTEGLGIGCVREPEVAVALCRAYN